MGELTEKEKAQKYDEAIRRAKISLGCCDSASTTTKNLVYDIFPELKNKDEEIRKAIIEFFELQDDNTTYSLIPKKDILAWLEKQADKDKLIKELGEYKVKYTQEVLSQQLENECEQKPAAWSKDDEAMFQSCTGAIWAADSCLYEDKQDIEAWLESLKNRVQPQVKEWSEEDDAYKIFAISAVEDYYDEENPLQKAIVDWLKSLKDRMSWKPSKEQMDALLGVMVESGFNYIDYNTLESLYNDLKKL